MNTENHQYVADANGFDRVTKSEVNKKNIMPVSYAGKLRYMTENFHDAVAVSRVHGLLDIFTDFTYDPNWPEIVQGLEHGQQAVDEADFTAQVYQLKLLEYVEKIKTGQVFGPVVTVLHCVDFQKRTLPHAHILVWLKKIMGRDLRPLMLTMMLLRLHMIMPWRLHFAALDLTTKALSTKTSENCFAIAVFTRLAKCPE
ncbi:uncharacterized protein LOC119267340 isoform X1 [Triticum dicoccoides]|uniref:uncharacterized protein LOC119267340 isoform X1 n=1 Tax=Triticum dicoccoides TaxID=85692 RepID=UPI00188F4142|nr:uncharacterized protein LOC119267340 isoform X1 [Triticum dicoccoides]